MSAIPLLHDLISLYWQYSDILPNPNTVNRILCKRKALWFTGSHPNVEKTFAAFASSILEVLPLLKVRISRENLYYSLKICLETNLLHIAFVINFMVACKLCITHSMYVCFVNKRSIHAPAAHSSFKLQVYNLSIDK